MRRAHAPELAARFRRGALLLWIRGIGSSNDLRRKRGRSACVVGYPQRMKRFADPKPDRVSGPNSESPQAHSVPVRTPHARPAVNGRVSTHPPDNLLALVDQGLYAGHRAAGLNLVIQVVWLFDHDLDLDALRHFNHQLRRGLLGRHIERSPLPFARPRWVIDRGPADIVVAQRARPRTELGDWADECSQVPVDAERAPGWHLSVLPLTDGTTAVSIVLSHYVVDGLGLAIVLTDAARGDSRDLGYPPPQSRTRPRALIQDARQTGQDARAVGRAIVASAKLARKQVRAKQAVARSPASRAVALRATDGDAVVVPNVSIRIDMAEWDARAQALGGNRRTLIAALGAKLAEGVGRRPAGDGLITLHLPMSERTEGDTRANTMSIAVVNVDPTGVTTDLGELRAAIKQAVATLREAPDEALQLRPLIPFTPKPALKRMVDAGLTDPDAPMLCSNLDEFNPWLNRLDGTDGEMVLTRAIGQGVTRQWLEATGGQMTLQSWHIRDGAYIYFTVNAYQPGAENSTAALRELVTRTLSELGLTGTITI